MDLALILNRLIVLEADLLACQTETEPTPPLNCVAVLDGPQTSVSISFTTPTSPGGTPITGYEAISTPGGFSASGVALPLVIAGLDGANGEYTFEVRAVNAVGHSLPCVTAAVGTNALQSQLSKYTEPFILAGATGNQVFPQYPLWRSPDGTSASWSPLMNDVSLLESGTGILAIAYNGVDQWVVGMGGGSIIAYSSDGLNWTGVTGLPGGLTRVSAVAYGIDRWVAVGLDGGVGDVTYSLDGVAWNAAVGQFSGEGLSVAHDGVGLFVATGNGPVGVASSPDGIAWTARTPSGYPGFGAGKVIYSATDGVWAVLSSDGAVYRSADATTWTAVSTGLNSASTFGFNGVDLWVANGSVGGANLRMSTSSDGVVWTAVVSTLSFTDIVYADGLWVGAGADMYTSPDGVTWTTAAGSGRMFTSGVTLGLKRLLPL
jgi:hypothetical protein